MPTVDAGTVPFEVLSLLGRDRAALPGRWEPVTLPGFPPGVERLRYRATGATEHGPVQVQIFAQLQGGRVQAVAVDVPGYLTVLADGPPSAGHLVAVPRSRRTPAGQVNWVGLVDDEVVDLGTAY